MAMVKYRYSPRAPKAKPAASMADQTCTLVPSMMDKMIERSKRAIASARLGIAQTSKFLINTTLKAVSIYFFYN